MAFLLTDAAALLLATALQLTPGAHSLKAQKFTGRRGSAGKAPLQDDC
jgi:hypothetical protein